MTNEEIIISNQRQQSKLSWKRKQMVEMAGQIYKHYFDLGFVLPKGGAGIEKQIEYQFVYNGYDTEEFDAFWDMHRDLIKFYYSIKRTNKAIYAQFIDFAGSRKVQLISAWYNKHRFDFVWLWRKSQLVRKMYRTWLEANEALRHKTNAIHLVLTVPHDSTGFQGKTFYAKELSDKFHELRRLEFWKRYVHGGEYGIEVKKSKSGGLHIHIHSLCFLHRNVTTEIDGKDSTVNTFRQYLKENWERLTGATQVHAETLYYYKRNASGHYEKEQVKKFNIKTQMWENVSKLEVCNVVNPDGTMTKKTLTIPVMARKKHYITDKSTTEEYLSAVLECIKYHFKSDVAEDKDGNYDIELMQEILCESKGLRFYSRYGALYDCKELNINNATATEGSEKDESEDIKGSSDTALANLIDPFTQEKAQNYELIVATPENFTYGSKYEKYKLKVFDQKALVVNDGIEIKDIIKALNQGKISTITRAIKEFNNPKKNKNNEYKIRECAN